MAHPRAPQEMALLVTDLTAGENTLGKAHLPGEELCSSSELPLIRPKSTENPQSDLCGLGQQEKGGNSQGAAGLVRTLLPKKEYSGEKRGLEKSRKVKHKERGGQTLF